MSQAGRRSSLRRVVTVVALAAAGWAVFGLPTSDAAEGQPGESDGRFLEGLPESAGSSEKVDASPRSGASGGRIVVVADGETLWELVLPHAPEGSDPHAWIAEVAEHNGIDPGHVQPGDALRIPPS